MYIRDLTSRRPRAIANRTLRNHRVEIVDLTSSPEPEPAADSPNSHHHISHPLSHIPFRESPAKRQKINHIRDSGDCENTTALLKSFRPRSTPSTKTIASGNHGTSTQASPHERASLRKCPPASPTKQQPAPTNVNRLGFAPFRKTTLEKLAKLRGLGGSFIKAGTTNTSKNKLTEEQEGDTFSRPAATQSASVYGNGVRTPGSGAAYYSSSQTPAQTRNMPQSASMVPQDYPHGLPLPRPTNFIDTSSPYTPPYASHPPPARPTTISRPTAPPPLRVTPIPLPSMPSTSPSLRHPAPTSGRPNAAYSSPTNPASSFPVAVSSERSAGPSMGQCAAVNSPQPDPSSLGKGKSRYPPWTLEEDSVIVYLKHGLEWGFKQIAHVLTGRSQGAANTRYCNHLKYGYDMAHAIEIIQSSKWAHVLQPEKHAEILARPVPLPPITITRLSTGFDSPLPATADGTVTLQRERRAAQRPTDYYSKDYYTHAFEHESPSNTEPQEPSTEGHPSVQTAGFLGTEIRGRSARTVRGPVSTRKSRSYKPYLSYHERFALRGGFEEGEWQELKDWEGTKVHIPFTKEELKSIEHVVTSKSTGTTGSILKNLTEPQILRVASQARSSLPERTKESIEAFLRDAVDGRMPKAGVLRLGGQKYSSSTISSVLRNRELGMRTTRRDYSKGGAIQLQTPIVESIGPSLTFTGTSGDVNTIAWAPNGTQFAAGSACLVDSDSMQYNRPNNLLFGDISRKMLYEIPDHYTERERPESGVNSSHSMHVTQDHRLFQTVSMVAFSPDNSLLFTAGYDNVVRVYDVYDTEQPELWRPAIRHASKVDLISVSPQGLLATGCQRSEKNSIRVINPYLLNAESSERFDENGNKLKRVVHSFASRKAAERPDNDIYPSALRFDWSGEYLLAGFASTKREELTSGDTCLWDVRTGAQMTIFPETRNVFDVAWNSNRWKAPLFAVGCVAGTNVNRGTRSVIKLYDIRAPGRYGMSLELDCPALDMNDVLFCPYDDTLIIAGCTNGKTYVWDIRQPRPEDHLYSLVHGEPLMELGDDDPASRERLDTGIRFCSWGHDRRRLYTGSSDGVVKTWDPYRAPDDVFVRDIVQLNSGVMSGAFSPDYTSLLLGEVNGTINSLEVGQFGRSIKDMDYFDLISFEDEAHASDDANDTDKSNKEDSGVATAQQLLQTQQMALRQMGSLPIRQAVQGPNYAGPYDNATDAPELRQAAAQFQLLHCAPPTEQCSLPACREAASSNIVPEEAGDSGRSADRIPGTLRSLARTTSSLDNDKVGKRPANSSIVPPVLKCSKCNIRPARPRTEADAAAATAENDDNDDDDDVDASKPLCERCNFGCPRCGRKAGILSHNEDSVIAGVFCLRCRAVWRADVLGYKLVYQHHGGDGDGGGGDDVGGDDEGWDPRLDERFMYERARVMGIWRRTPTTTPAAAAGAGSAHDNGKKAIRRKPRETQVERDKRRGHDYLADDGEDCIQEHYHSLWQDRPASPL